MPLAALVIGILSAGCATDGRDPRPRVELPPTQALASAADGRAALAGLSVVPRPPARSDYLREAFGGRWTDIDGNGCNQRDDALVRDAVPGTVRVQAQGACAHDVLAGTWVDPYNGKQLVLTDLKDQSQAQAVQIDHIVALAEAWVSGARSWAPEKREAFANDLDVLVASDGPTNASKGSSDPAAWRPRKHYQCDYALRWIEVKARWELEVDPSEVAALEDMLTTCR